MNSSDLVICKSPSWIPLKHAVKVTGDTWQAGQNCILNSEILIGKKPVNRMHTKVCVVKSKAMKSSNLI